MRSPPNQTWHEQHLRLDPARVRPDCRRQSQGREREKFPPRHHQFGHLMVYLTGFWVRSPLRLPESVRWVDCRQAKRREHTDQSDEREEYPPVSARRGVALECAQHPENRDHKKQWLAGCQFCQYRRHDDHPALRAPERAESAGAVELPDRRKVEQIQKSPRAAQDDQYWVV